MPLLNRLWREKIETLEDIRVFILKHFSHIAERETKLLVDLYKQGSGIPLSLK